MAVGVWHRIIYILYGWIEGGSGQWDINIEHQTKPNQALLTHPLPSSFLLCNTNPKDNRRCIHQASTPFCCCEFLMLWCPFLYGGLRADRLLHTRYIYTRLLHVLLLQLLDTFIRLVW